MYVSTKIDEETQLVIEVPLSADHSNILLTKIGSYITVIMEALAKIVEPLHGKDGCRTRVEFHVNAELNEPQDRVTILERHTNEIVLHSLWAGVPWPQTRTQYPNPPTLEHNSELPRATLIQQVGQYYSYLNYPQHYQEIPQTSYPRERLNNVPDYHHRMTNVGHPTGTKLSDAFLQSFNGLLPEILNSDGSADGGTLPIVGNTVGLIDGALLPDISNTDSLPDLERGALSLVSTN
jgi:hypothetical protein